jgi:hypothetical protein
MKDKKIRFIIFAKKGNLPDLISHLKRTKYKGTKIEKIKNCLTAIISSNKCERLIQVLEKNGDDFDNYELPIIGKSDNQTKLSKFTA